MLASFLCPLTAVICLASKPDLSKIVTAVALIGLNFRIPVHDCVTLNACSRSPAVSKYLHMETKENYLRSMLPQSRSPHIILQSCLTATRRQTAGHHFDCKPSLSANITAHAIGTINNNTYLSYILTKLKRKTSKIKRHILISIIYLHYRTPKTVYKDFHSSFAQMRSSACAFVLGL